MLDFVDILVICLVQETLLFLHISIQATPPPAVLTALWNGECGQGDRQGSNRGHGLNTELTELDKRDLTLRQKNLEEKKTF